MNRKSNVLVFSAGEINSVEIFDALSYNVNVRLFGCSSCNRHGEYIFKRYKGDLPTINSPSFIGEFNNLIHEWDIDYVFPTHDSIALYLSKYQDEIDATVIVSDYNTAIVCRDKKKTYTLFSEESFCPKIYESFSEFPVFVKPIDGQGAQGAVVVNAEKDIPRDFDYSHNVICELLPGDELTVDCLTDCNGKLVSVLPRKRNRLLAGVSVSGESIDADDEITNIAEIINSKLKFKALWYFQIKKDLHGKYKLLEISTRTAGAMCLSRARGINLPLLSLYIFQGKGVSAIENPYKVMMDRTLISRYKINYAYKSVYIDYDDTIIIDNEVCLQTIRFLYQCKNNKIPIYLISRHDEDHEDKLEDNMTHFCINKEMFKDIYKISMLEKKVDYINDADPIFVDNSFEERRLVYQKLGIPVFDIDELEVLLDWKL